VREHALDRKMRFACIGRAENCRYALEGSALIASYTRRVHRREHGHFAGPLQLGCA